MEIIEMEDQKEINRLKKKINEIKSFYKNGFSRFFSDENVNNSNFRNNLDIRHEISKKIESNNKYKKDYITIETNAYNDYNYRKRKYNDYIYKTEVKKGIKSFYK